MDANITVTVMRMRCCAPAAAWTAVGGGAGGGVAAAAHGLTVVASAPDTAPASDGVGADAGVDAGVVASDWGDAGADGGFAATASDAGWRTDAVFRDGRWHAQPLSWWPPATAPCGTRHTMYFAGSILTAIHKCQLAQSHTASANCSMSP